MRTLIVYGTDSPFAADVSRAIADTGAFASLGDVDVTPASAADAGAFAAAAYIVVGGATCPDDGPPEGATLHQWFSTLRSTPGKPGAAFEVRRECHPAGRCASGVNRKLHQHHFHVAAPAGSFVVDDAGTLAVDETIRIEDWAEMVAAGFGAVARKRREHELL
jgi:hypothetical protein